MTNPNESKGLPALRGEIVEYLKQNGEASISEMAGIMKVSGEAVRRQLVSLEAEGWVQKTGARRNPDQAGRPVTYYGLTNSGDHLFPRHYDTLAIEIFQALRDSGGESAVRTLLNSIVDRNVDAWSPELIDLPLEARLKKLLTLYGKADEYMSLVMNDPDGPYLVERNCPYQNVATEFPQLCSVTINTLTRLTGYSVRREKKLQDGDRRCVFRVLIDQPIDAKKHKFEFETEK